MFYPFHSAFLCSQGHSHIGIHFHCNWERTLHRFDKVRLSMVSVKQKESKTKTVDVCTNFQQRFGYGICIIFEEKK